MSAVPGNRFATITDYDHAGWVWIASLLSLTFSFLFLGVRSISKWQRYALDDTLVITAYVFALAHWITVFTALDKGLGKSHSIVANLAGLKEAAKLVFASRIFLIITLYLSKASVLVLIRQLFAEHMRKARTICTLSLALTVILGISTIFAVSVKCTPDDTLDPNGQCPGNALRWKLTVTSDVVTEILLVALPTYFVSQLQMKPKRKVMVAIAFASRLPVAALSIIQLHSYQDFLDGGAPSLDLAATISWQEAWLNFSLMAATIPCLKGFMKSFTTSGVTGTMGYGSSHGNAGGSHNQRYELSSFNKGQRTQDRSQRQSHSRLNDIGYTANIYSPSHKDSASRTSHGSTEIIIKKVVEITTAD